VFFSERLNGEARFFLLLNQLEPHLLLVAFCSCTSSIARCGWIQNRIYKDVAGLCRAATLKEIEAQGWSLNPGRYVGVAPGEDVSDEDFQEQLVALNEELEVLNTQARELEQTIAANVASILEN